MRNLKIIACSALLAGMLPMPVALADTIHETCPDVDDAGDVRCYPIHYTAKTEVHPSGLPIVAYLFVPKDLPASGEALPAVLFAHGSGSMFSNGRHNEGLNNKQAQWVRQFTAEKGIVSLHVSSFHSRYYMLPDTAGDQRMLDWENPPAPGPMGGDDYRATSTAGGLYPYKDEDTGEIITPPYDNIPFDPNAEEWKDQSNGRAGISEIIERPYDLEAGYDYLVGMINGTTMPNARGETLAEGFASGNSQKINDLVPDLVIDPERVFVYGTSHGGQTIQALAHKPRATASSHPMGNHPRFAAYFNFYGGCGLYGAFGGADEDSTWFPVGPFFSLHGELDDIWQESSEPTTRETWEKGECAPRIDNALANPDMNTLLATVLIADADHSFSGAEKGEGDDWTAKVYSDYEVVLPIMDAVGWISWARRTGRSVAPSFNDLGISNNNASFTTLPLTPINAPYNKRITDTGTNQIDIPDLRDFALDLDTVFDNHTREGSLAYFIADNAGPIGISTEFHIEGSSTLKVSLADDSLSGLSSDDLLIEFHLQVVGPDGGKAYTTGRLSSTGGNGGKLAFSPSVRTRNGLTLTTPVVDGKINTNLQGFVATDYGLEEMAPLAFLTAGSHFDDDEPLRLNFSGQLAGDVSGLPRTYTFHAQSGGLPVTVELQLRQGDRTDLVDMTLVKTTAVTGTIPKSITVETPDFSELAITPGIPSSGPLLISDDTSGWGSESGGCGTGCGGDGGSGDGGSGDGGSGDGPDGGPDGGPGGGQSSGGSGGGGALLWLLPYALLLRRHNYS